VDLDLSLAPRYGDAQLRWESGDGRWMAMDEFLSKYLHLNLTHGISEDAAQKALEDLRNETER